MAGRSGDGPMTQAPRILVVDDDALIQESLSLFLRLHGYTVERAMTARDGLNAVYRRRTDLVILDLTLPDGDGAEVCEEIRKISDMPIIALSVRSGDQSKVSLLERGADDYMTKPFSSDELLARIRVALRRVGHGADSGRMDRGHLVIDLDRRRVVVGEREIRLTPKEFELMVYLARHPNRVMPHQAILLAIWGEHSVDRPEQLWALVTKVRRKIEPEPDEPRYLVSEPWVGYRLVTESDGRLAEQR
jgi:two-component system KDP operon response regulator KdpE